MWQKIKNYYHLGQALAVAICFSFPPKKLTVVGVTGTDGKTTTVNMIYHILKSAGKKVSMISSVNAKIADKDYDTGFHVSTPNPWQVQKLLKKAVAGGSEYFVMEATSHGLDQNRLAFINFKIAALTNISHEHLDYHKTLGNYTKAKLKLFQNTPVSVLNADDESFEFFKSQIKGKIISYSKNKKTDFNLKNTKLKLQVPGDFNLSNALAAVSVCTQLGIEKQKAISALASFRGVKGRMEQINLGQDFKVFIDFAHTPNGLKQALSSLRSQVEGQRSTKLIAVFGSAGERDKSKRPKMGKVAGELADIIVLTAEDPRWEDPKDIVLEIASGINKKNDKQLFIIVDRKSAIDFAIGLAKKGDIVGIFGKGHEKSMTYGKKETSWDEFEVAKTAIKRRMNG